MDALLLAATAAVAVLAAFLIVVTVLTYAIADVFVRTRLMMTAFFAFIVITLTLSFWQYAAASLWYSVPAALIGALVGHIVGVKAAQEKLMMQGAEEYMEHFAHIHVADIKNLHWWSLINFYSVAGGLLLINLVGASQVLFAGREPLALVTCAVGAFLLGSIAPYLIHLWTIRTAQNKTSITSEA